MVDELGTDWIFVELGISFGSLVDAVDSEVELI